MTQAVLLQLKWPNLSTLGPCGSLPTVWHSTSATQACLLNQSDYNLVHNVHLTTLTCVLTGSLLILQHSITVSDSRWGPNSRMNIPLVRRNPQLSSLFSTLTPPANTEKRKAEAEHIRQKYPDHIHLWDSMVSMCSIRMRYFYGYNLDFADASMPITTYDIVEPAQRFPRRVLSMWLVDSSLLNPLRD
jgi:hypothetical protein